MTGIIWETEWNFSNYLYHELTRIWMVDYANKKPCFTIVKYRKGKEGIKFQFLKLSFFECEYDTL